MNNNRCICCGEIIPEGLQVCWTCEHKVMEGKDDVGIFDGTKDEISTEE